MVSGVTLDDVVAELLAAGAGGNGDRPYVFKEATPGG